MEDFLKTLYKMSASSMDDGIDLLFSIVPSMLGDKKFEEINNLLTKIDLTRLNTSVIYACVNLTSDFRFQLPVWPDFYQDCREEFARRGEPKKKIRSLFDQYLVPDEKRLFNPDAPPYISPEEKMDDKIKSKIALAKQLGDKDLEDLLNYYQAERLRHHEREEKFRKLVVLIGREELRQRCIKGLREVADTLEKTTSGWPDVYYCNLPEDPLMKKTFIDGIEVVISYPWPG